MSEADGDGRQQAATKLQSAERARNARARLLRSKNATVVVQSSFRGFSSRRYSTTRPANSARATSFAAGASSRRQSPFRGSRRSSREGDDSTGTAVTHSVAQAMFSKARAASEVQRLHADGTTAGRGQASTWMDTQAADARRKALLFDARTLSPMDTTIRIDKLGQTVVVRLLRSPVTWAVFAVYGVTAFACRQDYWRFHDRMMGDSFDGSDTLITFMIVFYVGYCYNRYSAMFADLELTMRSIICCCSVARVSFKDSAAQYDLWRFLNLLHVTAYCGVTATYNKANLCDEFCAQHGLLSDPVVRERLEAMDIESPQAWSMCLVWALEVVHQRAEAKDFASPIHKERSSTSQPLVPRSLASMRRSTRCSLTSTRTSCPPRARSSSWHRPSSRASTLSRRPPSPLASSSLSLQSCCRPPQSSVCCSSATSSPTRSDQTPSPSPCATLSTSHAPLLSRRWLSSACAHTLAHL
jgi:hypothetical protein